MTERTAAIPAVTGTPSRHFADVTVIYGPDVGSHQRLGERTRVGRDPNTEFVLSDRGVSSCHVELRLTPQGVAVVDMGSRNGTYVDGRRVEEVLVEHHAVLRLGDSVLSLRSRARERWSAPVGERLVGGASLAGVRRKVSLVGPTELPVLILGETGTGKDVVAHMLHVASGRAGSFVPVNCAALPESLVEAELFGHAKAAFTGAQKASPGLFVAAHGGTLFLDEVGELAPSIQAKLLRVLEDGQVRPLGSTKSSKVDVRVISATNRNVRAPETVDFRSDLLARLAGVEVELPPLRERREDIPALVAHGLRRLGLGCELDATAIEAMCVYDWPMNVRELLTVLRATGLAPEREVCLDNLPLRVRAHLESRRSEHAAALDSIPNVPPPSPRAKRTDKQSVESAMREHAGNVRRASASLGISRMHLYRLLGNFGFTAASFRPERAARAQHGTNTAKDVR